MPRLARYSANACQYTPVVSIAGMNHIGAMLVEPLSEGGKALIVVGKDLVPVLAIGQAQGTIELGLGDIDTQIHGDFSNVSNGVPSTIHLVNAGYRQAGPRYCSIWKKEE